MCSLSCTKQIVLLIFNRHTCISHLNLCEAFLVFTFPGSFAICKYGRCTWPEDNEGNPIPSPTPVRCTPSSVSNQMCAEKIQGSTCAAGPTGSTQCQCPSNHQQLHGLCVPVIHSESLYEAIT